MSNNAFKVLMFKSLEKIAAGSAHVYLKSEGANVQVVFRNNTKMSKSIKKNLE